MKKFLSFCLIALTLCVPSYAADETELAKKTVTSLQYVKAKLAERQDKVEAQSGTKAMTYGNNGSYDPGEISARDVKTTLGSSITDPALPTVSAVNAQLANKQNKVPAKDTNTVITYTGTSGVIGEKGIYQNSGSYSAQSDNLVDAGTFNAALKTGLDNEFVCADYDANGLCWLWTIHNEKNSLPAGYTQLQYIISNGTQYIDTGVKASNNTRVDGDFYINSGFSGHVFGSYDSGKYFRMYVPSSSVTGSVFDNASFTPSSIVPSAFTPGTKIHIRLDNTGIYIGNNTYTYTSTPSTFTATSNMYLGAINAYTGNTSYLKGRIYNFSIVENGVLVRNFVPAKNSSNKVGMYDTVSSTFFTSATSGTNFEAGPAATDAATYTTLVPNEYIPIEYLESSGTQYINTGFSPSADDDLAIDFEFYSPQVIGKNICGVGVGEWGTAKGWVVGFAASSGSNAWNQKSVPDVVYSQIGMSAGNWYRVKINSTGYFVNDALKKRISSTAAYTTDLGNFYIFRANNKSSGSYNNFSGRIGRFKLFRNGSLVFNGIPAKLNGVAGMYDTVSGTFKTNAGSGTFSTGNEINNNVYVPQVQ